MTTSNPELAATIGANLRRTREARGLTIREVGERAGIAFGNYAMWEGGRAVASVAGLVAVADVFACPVDDLVRPFEPVATDPFNYAAIWNTAGDAYADHVHADGERPAGEDFHIAAQAAGHAAMLVCMDQILDRFPGEWDTDRFAWLVALRAEVDGE